MLRLSNKHPAPAETPVQAGRRTAPVRQSAGGLPERVGDLESSTVCVSPLDPNSRVMEMFEAQPELHGVVAVEHGFPAGLINRQDFFTKFARPYARELFLRRECALFLDRDAFVVEAAEPISEVAARAAALGEKALADGCIVVEDGRFLGLCAGVTLVRALSDLQGEQHRRQV